jgi:hypothetical protein
MRKQKGGEERPILLALGCRGRCDHCGVSYAVDVRVQALHGGTAALRTVQPERRVRPSRCSSAGDTRVDRQSPPAIFRRLRGFATWRAPESPCGGIGRRARLKIEFRKECWFDSGQGHQHIVALLNFSSSAPDQNSRFSIRTEQPDQRHLGSRRFGHELSPLLDHDFSSRFTIVADDLDRSRFLLLPLPAPLGPLLTTFELTLLRTLHVGVTGPGKSIFRRAGLLTRYYLRSG